MPANPPLTLFRTLVLLGALAAPAAGAGQSAGAGPPEKIVDVAIEGVRPTMRDSQTGDVLLDYRGVPLFDTAGLKGAVEPAVRVQVQPDGFDIVYTFRNAGDAPAPMATLKLGIVTLGDNPIYQEMRAAQAAVPADPARFSAHTFDYPASLYSPVSVFRDDDHAIGVSLQYPILEYRHDVAITLRSPGGRLAKGPGGRGFEIDHALSAPAGQTPREGPGDKPAAPGRPKGPAPARPVNFVQPGAEAAPPPADTAKRAKSRGPWPRNPGLIGPGQERTYTVSVRVTRRPDEWVRTLVPYRDFFRRLYGGVTYQRHTGAINGVVMANIARVSPQNPYGWSGAHPRPDQAGYKPWADDIKRRKGWSGFMLWMPTGMYDQGDPAMAVPYQVATRWTADPRLASALDPVSGLASIPAATGAELGLWFNRALEVPKGWSGDDRTPLDPDDPSLAGAAFAELDAASAAGVTMIGLDTFSSQITPAWKLYPWLRRLREKYPRITFAIEPITFDIMHSLAPTFLRAYDDKSKPSSVEGLYKIRGPLLMADFLLPGHETWGAMRYGGYRALGVPVTADLIAADARRFASWGFRPLLITDFDLGPPVQAAESWRSSIPADLQLPEVSKDK